MAKISNREIRQLIIERIKTLSPGWKISIGKEGDFSKEELIKHIQKGDKIGEKITKVQLSYLRSMKKGIFFNEK